MYKSNFEDGEIQETSMDSNRDVSSQSIHSSEQGWMNKNIKKYLVI
jgi:hypothetical protein